MSAPMGRPPVEIDPQQLRDLMRFNPTQEQTAAFFRCSISVISDRIQQWFGLTFKEFRDQELVHTKMGLVQRALHRAHGGSDILLIFCLKNMNGWNDKVEISAGQNERPFMLSYNMEQIDEYVEVIDAEVVP